MSALVLALVFLAGYGFRAVLSVEPSIVTLQRADDEWVDAGGKYGARERFGYNQRQVRELTDRIAANQRERRWLIDQLADKHLDEVSTERELRLIRGGE